MKEILNDKKVLNYVTKMSNPDILFKITQALINKKIANNNTKNDTPILQPINKQ